MQAIENPMQLAFNLAGLRKLLIETHQYTDASEEVEAAIVHLDGMIKTLVTSFGVSKDGAASGPSNVLDGTQGLQAGTRDTTGSDGG